MVNGGCIVCFVYDFSSNLWILYNRVYYGVCLSSICMFYALQAVTVARIGSCNNKLLLRFCENAYTAMYNLTSMITVFSSAS